ncbi:MAG TPA: DUF2786 domain-containing protein [Acidimicrobiales bacterium]|nr:DUF2786 domain-containing protein [Acidimicrobiales bacterium]
MATDIARRIRALLDKAENTEYLHERDAFTAKAMALMADYRITEAMVDAARDPSDRRGSIGDREIQLGSGPYVRARLALLGPIADANSTSVVTYVGWDGRIAALHGYDSDLARVEMLYTSLLVQATSEASRMAVPRGNKTVSVRRSFLFGFASKVGERLARANAAAARAADTAGPTAAADGRAVSVAMVLADRRADVDDYVKQRYGRLGTLSAPRVSATGYGQGQTAGARADLGTHRDVAPAARGAIGS